jgi:hypothetical protein
MRKALAMAISTAFLRAAGVRCEKAATAQLLTVGVMEANGDGHLGPNLRLRDPSMI